MAYHAPFVSPAYRMVDTPHPATLEEDLLRKQCEIRTGRTAGPGGQHRNRVDTAIWVTHAPTGIVAHAHERRSQGQNLHMAIKRLRLKLAAQCRTPTGRDRHDASPLWQRRRQGEKLPVNPDHADYPALLAEALDVVVARRFDVAGAAGLLGITMSQLTRLIRHERHAFATLNQEREKVGLTKLRS